MIKYKSYFGEFVKDSLTENQKKALKVSGNGFSFMKVNDSLMLVRDSDTMVVTEEFNKGYLYGKVRVDQPLQDVLDGINTPSPEFTKGVIAAFDDHGEEEMLEE